MKKIITLLVLLVSTVAFAQQYNTKKGAVASGYDVVSYFSNEAKKGKKEFSTTYDGAKFRFSSQENLEMFKQNPTQYVPQYGGYCAYAIGKTGEKVAINPKTFKIRDNKLYLFYNSWGTNTLDLWLKEGAEDLQKQADINWSKINR